MGEMVFGLAIVWVHPYQAWIPTLDKLAKKLALLTTFGENWAYTFVQLNMFPSLNRVTSALWLGVTQ